MLETFVWYSHNNKFENNIKYSHNNNNNNNKFLFGNTTNYKKINKVTKTLLELGGLGYNLLFSHILT